MYSPSVYDVMINYSIGPDLRSPEVIDRIPQPNSTNVPLYTNISIYFSEPMNISTINNENIKLRKIGETNYIQTNISTSKTRSILDPTINLSMGTKYEVILNSSISDISGNDLGNDLTWSFTTIPLSFIDTNVTDFSGGYTYPCMHISEIDNGELMLAPTVGEEFFGTSLGHHFVNHRLFSLT